MKFLSFIKGSSDLTKKQEQMREMVTYVFFGVFTTLVNMISFIGFDLLFGSKDIPIIIFGWTADLLDTINTTIAWLLSVMFAFITNRIFVFKSKGHFLKEMIGFFSARILTLIIFEVGFLAIGTAIVENLFLLDKDQTALLIFGFDVTYLYIIKIVIAAFVVSSNYVLSKIFVFKNKKTECSSKQDNTSETR